MERERERRWKPSSHFASHSLSLALSLVHTTSNCQVVVKNQLVRVEVVKEVSGGEFVQHEEISRLRSRLQQLEVTVHARVRVRVRVRV